MHNLHPTGGTKRRVRERQNYVVGLHPNFVLIIQQPIKDVDTKTWSVDGYYDLDFVAVLLTVDSLDLAVSRKPRRNLE
jgi:hypothetical protein